MKRALAIRGMAEPIGLAVASQAATLCVNPGGTGGCYASIQAAVDDALVANSSVAPCDSGAFELPRRFARTGPGSHSLGRFADVTVSGRCDR